MPGTTKQPQPQTTEPRKRFRIRPAYVLLLALMALFAFKFIEKTGEVRRLAAEEAALQSSNNQAQQQNTRLRQDITYYHTPQYIESEARAVFGYTKPGETSIMTRPVNPPVVSERRAPPPPSAPPRPPWQQWWNALFR